MANLRNRRYRPQRKISRPRPGRRSSSIRSTQAEMPTVSIDSYSQCPPEPPGYDGNWYEECSKILRIR